MGELALFGGKPTSEMRMPISKPIFWEKTIKEVVDVLRSGYVCQGPKTREFEERFRERVVARYACAVNSWTATLHTAYLSILKPGDEVIVPAFKFFATASTIIHSHRMPVFSDIDPKHFLSTRRM